MLADQPERLPRQTGAANPRVIFIGMLNQFACAPLVALLDAGIEVAAVVVPANTSGGPAVTRVVPAQQPSHLPIVNPYLARTIVHIAWECDIPTFEISRPGDPATLALFADLRPDVACVACFPQRIPASLLALPPLGFLN